MNSTDEEDFTILLRKKTKQIHNFSDALVQSKFLLGLIDDNVWAEGLLVFSNVFYYLEDCMKKLPQDSNVCKFKNSALMRSKYLDIDLENYYGKDWKTKIPVKNCVSKYIQHLEELEKTKPDLLIAYIYHLYLGLLSGGRIIRKKKQIPFFSFSKSCCVVDIDDATTKELKKFIKNTTNDIAKTLDDHTKTSLLDESITVFQLNCDLIRSVDSVKYAIRKIISTILLLFIALGVFYTVVLNNFFFRNYEKEL